MLFSYDSVVSQNVSKIGPIIHFQNTKYNFGNIKEGDSYHNLEFQNKGNRPLIITSVTATCGCLSLSFPKEPISQGSRNFIKIKYNSSKPGKFRKIIVVKSNSEINPKMILEIKGNVILQ